MNKLLKIRKNIETKILELTLEELKNKATKSFIDITGKNKQEISQNIIEDDVRKTWFITKEI